MPVRLGARPQTGRGAQVPLLVQRHRRLAVRRSTLELRTRLVGTGRRRPFRTVDHHRVVLADLRTPRRFSSRIAAVPVRIDTVQTARLVQSPTLERLLQRLTRRRPEVFHEWVRVLHPMEQHARRRTIHISDRLKSLDDHVLVRRQCTGNPRRLVLARRIAGPRVMEAIRGCIRAERRANGRA